MRDSCEDALRGCVDSMYWTGILQGCISTLGCVVGIARLTTDLILVMYPLVTISSHVDSAVQPHALSLARMARTLIYPTHPSLHNGDDNEFRVFACI